MNIHINKHTRLQPWEGKTIFGDFPLHLRCGNMTVTLLFADADSIRQVYEMLANLLAEVEGGENFLQSWSPSVSAGRKTRRPHLGSFPDGG